MILSILENNRVNPAQNHTSTRIFVISNSRIFQNVKGLVMNFMNPSKNVLDILSTPISMLPKKNITTFQCSKGSVSHVARFVKRTFNSSTMRALITCIGYHFQLHGISPLRRRKHPYLEGQAATILVELVAEDHQDAHREEQ